MTETIDIILLAWFCMNVVIFLIILAVEGRR